MWIPSVPFFRKTVSYTHLANVGYGLKIRKVPKETIASEVEKALQLVQLPGYDKRMPSELSGGQRQRVAIARAIVNHPQVLLLDEPLGALDLQLRRQMQLELKRLQKKLGITFIYITHDQEEAINMSDRIVVMNEGVFEPVSYTHLDVYKRQLHNLCLYSIIFNSILFMDAQTLEYLFICIFHIAQISAETVLIQLLMGVDVPQSAGCLLYTSRCV